MPVLTHTIRLFPDAAQQDQLLELMRLRNMLWNQLFAIYQQYYQQTKKSMSEFDLNNCLPALKKQIPELNNYNSKAAQIVSKQLAISYKSFFTKLKNKDTAAKPPQPVDEKKVVSITYNQSGWLFKDNTVKFNKIAAPINYRAKNNLTSLKIKEVRIKFRNNKWLCDIVEEYSNLMQTNTHNKVLDLGLKRLATGIDSDGKTIQLPNKAKKISKYFQKQIAKISSKISKKKRGSKKQRKLSKVRRKLYNKKNTQVKQTLHIQSKNIANMNYHTVVMGDLSVKQLMSTDNKKKGIRKSFHQSAIDTFRQFLTYKCIEKTNVINLDERNTTQLNCLTNEKFDKKIELQDRIVQLSDDIIIDRDLNSAINIYNRYQRNHLAALTPPLDLSNVLKQNNLFKKTS